MQNQAKVNENDLEQKERDEMNENETFALFLRTEKYLC